MKTFIKYLFIVYTTLAEIRRIRAEQDAAFQETLRLDQERERQKLEAEEAEKARIQAEIDRKENIARQKIELAKEIPNEPPVNEPTAVRIVIKLPGGQRLERRFYKSQSCKVDISSLLTLD